MRPSPCPPVLDDFPSSPSSAWSCSRSRSPSSATQDHTSPPTPDSCFSPAPTIVSPDEFTLQIDLQLDKVVRRSSHKSPITHQLPPQSSILSPTTDPCFLSGDDISKVQVLLRNTGRRENMYDRLESSPPARPRNAPRVLPVSQDSTSDDFSWEATHSALANPNELPDPSRCSLLIHEVSLLVGLAADDDHLLPGDSCPFVPDVQVPDILPLSLTPTKSLASRKHKIASPPRPTNTNIQVHSSNASIPSSINTHADNVNPSLHTEKPPSLRSTDIVTPISRHKSANAVRPSLSPHRRQGQVFHFEPPLSNAPHRKAVDLRLDETFSHPRRPPPKPTPNPLVNRCSSLDRLERSLLKLEAHAPSNHCKTQSEGRSSDHVVQRKDKCPSLPPPRRLKRQQSNHEIVRRNPSHPGHGCHLPGSPPPSRSTPLHQYVAPRICPAVPLGDERHEEDITPGSFMDMDIPHAEEASQKRQASFMSKNLKMKSLVTAARRVSRGVVAWGKNLAGSTKPSVTAKETTTARSARL